MLKMMFIQKLSPYFDRISLCIALMLLVLKYCAGSKHREINITLIMGKALIFFFDIFKVELKITGIDIFCVEKANFMEI